MSKQPAYAIRLSVTEDISRAFARAKKLYPTLSEPEILKLGLSKIIREDEETEREETRQSSAYAVGKDYLGDQAEDVYTADMGKKVSFL